MFAVDGQLYSLSIYDTFKDLHLSEDESLLFIARDKKITVVDPTNYTIVYREFFLNAQVTNRLSSPDKLKKTTVVNRFITIESRAQSTRECWVDLYRTFQHSQVNTCDLLDLKNVRLISQKFIISSNAKTLWIVTTKVVSQYIEEYDISNTTGVPILVASVAVPFLLVEVRRTILCKAHITQDDTLLGYENDIHKCIQSDRWN